MRVSVLFIFTFQAGNVNALWIFLTGQTPIMLAEDDDEMVSFLKNHLIDVQNTGPNKMPWKFQGAWNINGKSHITGFETM